MYLSMRQVALSIRPKSQELGNEFCVDPVGFGLCASAGCEGFDLRR
jgi:hypothetical protein